MKRTRSLISKLPRVSALPSGMTLLVLVALIATGPILKRALASESLLHTPDYRNAELPIGRRVSDLLNRMTIEEKIAQVTTLWVKKPQERDLGPNITFQQRGSFSSEKAAIVLKFGIGQIARQREGTDARQAAEYANAVQKWLKDNTRLGIPAMFHDEALHGHMAKGSTNFPTPISLASSWDPELITKIFTVAALETRIRGGHQVLGPNLDLARDPRWGRTEETYGEDPYLASRMGVACIKALQGTAPNATPEFEARVDGEHVMATAKHFAAHGQPEGGTNTAPVNVSERILREVFLPTFEAAVKEAGVLSVMPSYNEIDGVPSHASEYLLGRILRQEWGFRGLVASDYNGISELISRHRIAGTKQEAARRALEAGVDIELPDPDCFLTLDQQIKTGLVPLAMLDTAVSRVLRAKFQLGLFEQPLVDVERAARITNSREHQDLAAEAARRSIVLLKNDRNLLPLNRQEVKSIAVIGPNAAMAHLGGYSDEPGRGVSVLDGMKAKVGDQIKINYAEGCKITVQGGKWWDDRSTLSDPETDAKLIAEAVEVAKISDIALLVIGGNEDTNKEAWADGHLGDRDNLDLIGRQDDLVKAIVATGKPVVVLLINSGPLSINYVAANVPAILEGFYLGQETGTAVADVVFGDHNPAGKLSVSFPRSVGQLPIFYNHKPTSRRGYLYTDKQPLFAFGHGLSYTTFAYSSLEVTPLKIGPAERAEVRVTVTNTGDRAGDEIVQLYIRDVVSSVTRPVMELKDFKRISLQPKERRTVSFTITPDKLSFLDINMKRVVEPGRFDIMVGTSSTKFEKAALEVVAR